MKAMIFAAGLGLRLRPLTDTLPKCLLQVAGKTLLEHVVDRLKRAGVEAIMINVHHLAHQIQSFVEQKKSFGLRVEFSYEAELLDTGGGLKKVSEFFKSGPLEEDFFAYNSDVYAEVDLNAMLAFHKSHQADATLAVSRRETSRYLRFDPQLRLVGRENRKTGQEILLVPDISFERLAFAGIHVLSSRIFNFMRTQAGRFSILDTYMEAVRQGATLVGYRIDGSLWADIGSPEKLDALRRQLEGGKLF